MALDQSLRRAIKNVADHGDTDIFPYPIENRILFDKADEVVALLLDGNANFDGSAWHWCPSERLFRRREGRPCGKRRLPVPRSDDGGQWVLDLPNALTERTDRLLHQRVAVEGGRTGIWTVSVESIDER